MSAPMLKQGRLWTACLWAGTVAAGLGALHAVWLFSAREAAGQAALLVPAVAWNEQQRDRALADIRSNPEVREAAWLSPRELARETGQLLPPDRWPEILSEEDAWLPWVLEILWRDPLARHGAIRTRVEAIRLDARWKIVLWDDDVLMSRRSALMTAFVLGGAGLGLVFILGLLALANGPPREGPALAEGASAVAICAAALGVMGAAAMVEGWYLDPETWAVAGAAAFILAGVAAPMIKRPKSPATSVANARASDAEAQAATPDPIRSAPVETAGQSPSPEPASATEVTRHEDE